MFYGIITQFFQNCIDLVILIRCKLLLQQLVSLIGLVKQLLMLLIDHINSNIVFRFHFKHNFNLLSYFFRILFGSFLDSFFESFFHSNYALFGQSFQCFLYFFNDFPG